MAFAASILAGLAAALATTLVVCGSIRLLSGDWRWLPTRFWLIGCAAAVLLLVAAALAALAVPS